DLAVSSAIYMNSVDTGWINDENPLPTAQRIAEEQGFQTPIDEAIALVDAAARILDPVLMGMEVMASMPDIERRKRRTGGGGAGGGGCTAGGDEAEGPPWGRFLKDYMATEW
ncbi:unnamed protein product, partial [Polarella glacialis]